MVVVLVVVVVVDVDDPVPPRTAVVVVDGLVPSDATGVVVVVVVVVVGITSGNGLTDSATIDKTRDAARRWSAPRAAVNRATESDVHDWV